VSVTENLQKSPYQGIGLFVDVFWNQLHNSLFTIHSGFQLVSVSSLIHGEIMTFWKNWRFNYHRRPNFGT